MTEPNRDYTVHLLSEMLRIRRFEEKCAELYQAEKIRGFLHLYIGEEAVGVGVMQVAGSGPGGAVTLADEKAAPAARRPVHPVARNMAQALGIDLAKVVGTGIGGAVTKADVEAAATTAEDLRATVFSVLGEIAPEADAAGIDPRKACASSSISIRWIFSPSSSGCISGSASRSRKATIPAWPPSTAPWST